MQGARLRSCKQCGRPFRMVREPFCVDCLKLQDEEFARITRYLRDNPKSGTQEISEATGVSVGQILYFLRSGRLDTVSFPMDVTLNCEICGKPIKSGSRCGPCAEKLANEFRKARSAEAGRSVEPKHEETAAKERTPDSYITYHRDK
ncbi:MAG TPA: hypothetical protein PLD23_04325 [Armatimonadota bacterium]|nr:hypothetical protein [Armatimonadota bacterium]